MMFPKSTLLLLFSIITYTVNAQNVGIGTNNPTNKLSVVGNADFSGNVGIGTSSPAGEIHVKSLSSSVSTLDQQNTDFNTSIVESSGWQSFTAGMSGYLTKIELVLNSQNGGGTYGTIEIYNGEGIGGSLLSTSNVIFFNTWAFQSFTLPNLVNVTVGNKYTIAFSVISITQLDVRLNNNNSYSAGMSNIPTNDLIFKTYVATSFVDAFVVSDTKVGIGTTTPLAKLDVSGNVKITDGTEAAGKVLTSDANGFATWASPASSWKLTGNNGTTASNNFIGTTDNHSLRFRTNNTEKMIVDSLGRVGIGINNPTAMLHIKTGSLVCDDATQRFFVNGNPKWDIGGFASGYEISRSGTAVDFYINGTNGKIGIGNTNPLAPLHVSGSGYLTSSMFRAYFNSTSGPDIVQNFAASGDIKVIADGYFWSNGGGFVATSDKRIKNIKGLSDTKDDLALLNKIQITDYTYIDKTNNGSTPQKKVIAQQLRDVYPQAVNTTKGIIPNVFEVAGSTRIENSQTIITTHKPHTFVTGDQVKLLLEDAGEKMVTVSVISPTVFSVNEKISSKIFVYGKLVNDLLNVDYDAVSMLNVSATQELYKRLLALETENTNLKTANENLKAEMQTVKVQSNERITALEEKMRQLLAPIKQHKLVTK